MSDDVVPGLGIATDESPEPSTSTSPAIPLARRNRRISRPPPFSEQIFDGFSGVQEDPKWVSQSSDLDEQKSCLQNLIVANAQKRLGNDAAVDKPNIHAQVTRQDCTDFFGSIDHSVVRDWEQAKRAPRATPPVAVSTLRNLVAARHITPGEQSSIASTPKSLNASSPKSIPTAPRAMRQGQELSSASKGSIEPGHKKRTRSLSTTSISSTPNANSATSATKNIHAPNRQLPTLESGEVALSPPPKQTTSTRVPPLPPSLRQPQEAFADRTSPNPSKMGSPSTSSSSFPSPRRRRKRRQSSASLSAHSPRRSPARFRRSPSTRSRSPPRFHRLPSPRRRSPYRSRYPPPSQGRYPGKRHRSPSPPPRRRLSHSPPPPRRQPITRGRSIVRTFSRSPRRSSTRSTEKPHDQPDRPMAARPQLPVPGNWFVKIGANLPQVVEGSFNVDPDTWDIWKLGTLLRLRLCCVPTAAVTEAQQALSAANNISPETLALAVSQIRTEWPPPGNIIIQVNRSQSNGKTWLPSDLKPGISLDFTQHVQQGINELRLIHLTGLPEYTFVLTAFSKSDERAWTEDDRLENHLEKLLITPPKDSLHPLLKISCHVVQQDL